VLASKSPLQPAKNLESFSKGRGLIVGEIVDHAAAN
jgi:hypothetical protein